MRFISKFSNYQFGAVKTITPEEAFATGQKQRKGFVAEFVQAGRGLSPWEIDAALATFKFQGVAVGENPVRRLSFFDTEFMCPDGLREEVEARLLAGDSFGTDYILVEKPVPVAPWPSYDKLTPRRGQTAEQVAEKIAELAEATGKVDDALTYERETQNRPLVIEKLEALLEEPEAEEQVIAA